MQKITEHKFWLQTKFSKTYWRHSPISGKKGKCIFKTCTIYDAINKTHSNNAFVMSQIYLLSLNLVCCNCSSNNKINWLHEQCQCILQTIKSWRNFFKNDGSIFIHHQNIRFLAIKMFKVFKGISPQILKEIFQFKDAVPYQLRLQIDLQISLSKEIIL